MAIVKGKSGSWKKLMAALYYEFDSIEEVFKFQANWEKELQEYEEKEIERLLKDTDTLEGRIEYRKKEYDTLKEKRRKQLKQEIETITHQLNQIEEDSKQARFFRKIKLFFKKRILKDRFFTLNNNFTYELEKPLMKHLKETEKLQSTHDHYTSNFELIIRQQTKSHRRRILKIVDALKENQSILIGAIGEEKAITELEKLPESFTVINDFQLKFDPHSIIEMKRIIFSLFKWII